MMNVEKKKKSPFKIDYNGKPEHQVLTKFPLNMYNILEKHLKSKYENDYEKESDFKYGKYIRETLIDYLDQVGCLERNHFQYTIIAIVSRNQLFESNPEVEYVFVYDDYTEYFSKKSSKTSFIKYQVNKVPILDYSIEDGARFNASQENKFHDAVKKYSQNVDSDILVLEIGLNNKLDTLDDGVYGKEDNKLLHTGCNYISTPDIVCGLIYEWYLDDNNNVKIDTINIVPFDLFLIIVEHYNKRILGLFEMISKSHDNKFPDSEIGKLQQRQNIIVDELEKVNQRKKDLEKDLEVINYQIEDLLS